MTAMQPIQAKVLLQPSTIIKRAAPKIAAVLAGFSKPQFNDNNNDDAEDCSSISPYTIHKQTNPLSVSSNDNTSSTTSSSTTATTKKSTSIPVEDLTEWQTNHMPILSTRQLELSLLEIQRRMNHKTRRRGGSKKMKNELEEQNLHTRATKQSQCTQSNDNNNKQPQKKEAAILIPICTVQGIPSILFTRRSASLSSHASQISFPGGYYDEVLDSDPNNAMQYIHDNDDMVGNSDDNNEWTKRLVHTAVREMHEELQYDIDILGSGTGVITHHASFYCQQHNNDETIKSKNNNNLPFITIVGQTQPIPSMTGSKVTPIIGTINYDLPSSSSSSTKEFETLFPGNPQETDWIFTIPIVNLIENETSEPLQRWSGSSSRESSNSNHNDDGNVKNNKNKKKSKQYEYWGPVYPIPNEYKKKQDGDKIWGLTAIVLRPLLRKVFRPVFC